ncbi:hypothetical protein DYQ86_11820 [Acidobacteria bacterium AB60]|nr:hypothetical protein DYQ86_11820 [Acidobacteria bacterium AB60]
MKIARFVALFTLAFLGFSSLAGGIPLILDPSGAILYMPLSLLRHSPFSKFLIPGILLATCNGALSLLAFDAVQLRWSCRGNLVTLQGFVIAGWVTIEVLYLRVIAWPHWVYWATGASSSAAALFFAPPGPRPPAKTYEPSRTVRRAAGKPAPFAPEIKSSPSQPMGSEGDVQCVDAALSCWDPSLCSPAPPFSDRASANASVPTTSR